MSDIELVKQLAKDIRDEHRENANTALRVGGAMLSIIELIEQYFTDDLLNDIKKLTDMWRFDEEMNVFSPYNVYSLLDVGAFGWHKSSGPSSAQYFGDLLDVKDTKPSSNQVWGWNGSQYTWLNMEGGGASSWEEIEGRPTWLDGYTGSIPYTRFENFTGNQVTLYVGNDAKTLLISSALDGYAKKTYLASYATQTWVEQQGFLTEHQSLDMYATQTWASGQFLGKNDKAKSAGSADKLATTREIWGHSFDGSNNVNGILNYVKDIMFNWQSETSRITTIHHDANALWVGMKADASASVVQPLILWDSPSYNLYHAQIYDLNCFRNGNVEIGGRGQAYPDKFIVNGSSRFTGDMHVHGNLYAHNMFEAPFIELVSPNPFIDFHQGSGTSDYTARIIEWSGKPGILEFCSANEKSGTIKLGNACITYDDVNKALKVYGADGEQMHMYATGDVGAFGCVGSFESLADLTLTNSLTVGNEIKVGNYIKIKKNNGVENNGITWDGTVITNSTPGAIYAESDFDIVGEVACSDLIASTLLLSGKGFGDNYCVTEISHSGTSIYISFRDGNRYKLTATKV